MTPSVPRGQRLPSVLVGGILGVGTFAYLLAFPPALNLADESTQLYSAKRVLAGEVLYRDVFEFITPLSYWTFALAYALGGTTIQTAKAAMAAANAASAVLTYALARKVAGVLEPAVAVLVFAGVCLPTWRMASPHWLSTMLCLATAAVLLCDRWRDSERLRPFCTGVLGGLVFCNQQQRGTALAFWLVSATAVLTWTATGGDRRQRLVRELTILAGGWLVVVSPLLGYCVWRASWREVYEALVLFVLLGYGRAYVGTMGWAQAHIIAGGELVYTWQWLLRAGPWILAAETAALGWRLWRRRGRAEGVRASLLLLAATMAASVLYFPDFIHVAFIAPFTLVVAAGMVHRLRGAGALGRLVPAVIAVATVALGVGAVGKARDAVLRAWAATPRLQATAFGTVAMSPVFATLFEKLQKAVSAVPAERRTLYAFPVDAWLYLTLPARNPTPFSYLSAGSGYSPEQFARVTRILEEGGADFVVVNEWLQRIVAPQKPFQSVLDRRYRIVPMSALFYVVYERTGEHY